MGSSECRSSTARHSIVTTLMESSVFYTILLHPPGNNTIVEQKPLAKVFSFPFLKHLLSGFFFSWEK